MTSIYDFLKVALHRLDEQYQIMSRAFPPPDFVQLGPVEQFRYAKKTDALLCFLKGIKLCSTLNAAILLNQTGYCQETLALQRIADDCCNDILFMLVPDDGVTGSTRQMRFLEDFFQEEFSDAGQPLTSRNARESVPRKNVHAAFGRIAKEILNPSDAQLVAKTIHGVLSGYIHGAYPHIMEFYGGLPPHFHLNGMRGTPRETETLRSITDQVYRAIMASELVSRKLGLENVEKSIRALLVEFETTLKLNLQEHPAQILQRAKSGLKR